MARQAQRAHILKQIYDRPRESRLPMSARHFVNVDGLSTGDLGTVRAAVLRACGQHTQVQYTRLSSEHCTRGQYGALISEYDQNLAFQLALGHRCFVYSCVTESGAIPRSISHGVPFLKFVLGRSWRVEHTPVQAALGAVVDGENHAWEWSSVEYGLRHPDKRRLKYCRFVAREMGVREPELYGVVAVRAPLAGADDASSGLARSSGEARTLPSVAALHDMGLRVVNPANADFVIVEETLRMKPLINLWGVRSSVLDEKGRQETERTERTDPDNS